MSGAAARRATETFPSSWADVLEWAAVLTLVGAAVIHASVFLAHYRAWALAGTLFLALQLVEIVLALAIATRRSRTTYVVTMAVSLGTVALWLLSRAVGLPVGPHASAPESIMRRDAVATLFELTTAAVLTPLVLPRPGPIAKGLLVTTVAVAGSGAMGFALRADVRDHQYGAGGHVEEAASASGSASGQFSLADARRHRRCAEGAADENGVSTDPRPEATVTASNLCFDKSTITLTASRRVVVHLENEERSARPFRAHTFSIYAISHLPEEHHPVLIGDPVAAGDATDYRFRAPSPGAYFFQCDIHRFMRGIAVFE